MWCVCGFDFSRRQASKPVHAGHHHVEQDDVDSLSLADVDGFLAAARREHVEVLGREPCLEQLHVRNDIVDYEYSSGHLRLYAVTV